MADEEMFELPDLGDEPMSSGDELSLSPIIAPVISRSSSRQTLGRHLIDAAAEGSPTACDQQTSFIAATCLQDSAFLQDVPESLKEKLEACSVKAFFYEILNPIDELDRRLRTDDATGYVCRPELVLHCVAAASSEVLLLVRGSTYQSFRLARTSSCPIKQLLVHHDFGPPLSRFICVLHSDGGLTVLHHATLKVVSQYEGVSAVESSDCEGRGQPSLFIIKTSGERVRWMSLCGGSTIQSSAATPVQQKVAKILSKSLQSSVQRLEALHSSNLQHEVLIARHTEELKVAAQAPSCVKECSEAVSLSPARWRILHRDSLILFITVHNISHSTISDLKLNLYPCNDDWSESEESNLSALQYSVGVFKCVVRRRRRGPTDIVSAAAVEALRPCLLKPGKQAIIVANCRLPSFSRGPRLQLRGLLIYSKMQTSRSQPRTAPDSETFANCTKCQTPVPPVSLNINELEKGGIDFLQRRVQPGVSLESLALVTGSCRCRAQLSSNLTSISIALLRSGLEQSISILEPGDVDGLLVLAPDRPFAPLHLAALLMDPQDEQSQQICLTLLYRDDMQAVALIHALKGALPSDTVLSILSSDLTLDIGRDNRSSNGSVQESEGKLSDIMNEIRRLILFISNNVSNKFNKYQTGETEGDVSMIKRTSPSTGMMESALQALFHSKRSEFLNLSEEICIDQTLYSEWKNELRHKLSELDTDYIAATKH